MTSAKPIRARSLMWKTKGLRTVRNGIGAVDVVRNSSSNRNTTYASTQHGIGDRLYGRLHAPCPSNAIISRAVSRSRFCRMRTSARAR
eukprot:6426895-Prymnesium_polylepis.1